MANWYYKEKERSQELKKPIFQDPQALFYLLWASLYLIFTESGLDFFQNLFLEFYQGNVMFNDMIRHTV